MKAAYSIKEALRRSKPPATNTICYNFPLRPRFLAQVLVPRDLSDDEGKTPLHVHHELGCAG